jgi:hypothetical protein
LFRAREHARARFDGLKLGRVGPKRQSTELLVLMMLLILSSVLSSSAFGATLTVGPTGAHSTITDAITAASSGDRIEVAPGTYAENIDAAGKDLDIVGTAGPGSTILSPPTSGFAVVIYDQGEAGSLQGFGIEPASGERGVYILNSSPSISNCRIEGAGDWDSSWGGGIYVSNGSPSLDDVEFIDNQGAKGGDLYIAMSSNVTLSNASIEGSSGKYGASIFILDSALAVSDTTAQDTTSQYSGGFAFFGRGHVHGLKPRHHRPPRGPKLRRGAVRDRPKHCDLVWWRSVGCHRRGVHVRLRRWRHLHGGLIHVFGDEPRFQRQHGLQRRCNRAD